MSNLVVMKTKPIEQLRREVVSLLDRHKGRIIMICRAYAPEREDLEDCFQDVAARIWEGYANFRGDCAENTWVYRVTINCAVNYSRRRSRRPRTVPLLDHDLIEEECGNDANTRRLYAMIGRLNPFDKAIVLLWLESLPYAEIAAVMGMTPKNVSVRLTRIRLQLKSMASENK